MDMVFFILIKYKIKGNFNKFMWKQYYFDIIAGFLFFTFIVEFLILIGSVASVNLIKPVNLCDHRTF